MTYDPSNDIAALARECRRIVLAARAAGVLVTRAQMLDLVADQLPDIALVTLREALSRAGVGYW